jgi:hypothetical protein
MGREEEQVRPVAGHFEVVGPDAVDGHRVPEVLGTAFDDPDVGGAAEEVQGREDR